MTVMSILSRKGHDVLTIEPTAALSAATKLLAERRIGALVVTGADHRIVGIISERDIVRALGERGAQVLEAPVAEVMTRKVVTCSERDTAPARGRSGAPRRHYLDWRCGEITARGHAARY